MPNWCTNNLVVTGSLDSIDGWVKGNHNGDGFLSFEVGVPSSPGEGEEGGLACRVGNWGTKWDLGENVEFERVERSGEVVCVYNFFTAWSPPFEWAVAVSVKNPNVSLVLNFDEPGVGFAGTYVVKNGVAVEEVKLASWGRCCVEDCENGVNFGVHWLDQQAGGACEEHVYFADDVEEVLWVERLKGDIFAAAEFNVGRVLETFLLQPEEINTVLNDSERAGSVRKLLWECSDDGQKVMLVQFWSVADLVAAVGVVETRMFLTEVYGWDERFGELAGLLAGTFTAGGGSLNVTVRNILSSN